MSADRQRNLDLIWNFVEVPGMRLAGRCGQNPSSVLVSDGAVILILGAMNISQCSTESVQHSFWSTCVPFLASRTCKNIRMCFALY